MESNVKTCFKCKSVKVISEFYKHSEMTDGHLNKCKDCTKFDTQNNYRENREYYVLYDKKRANLSHRKAAREKYKKSKIGKLAMASGRLEWKKRNPFKVLAHSRLNNAVRSGKITKPYFCVVCLSHAILHGHHHDYSKPLDVTWCCPSCHSHIHKGVIKMKEVQYV